jgi:hypothetical protein
MNRHQTITINAGAKLVGLTLAAAMTVALGCSDSGGGSTGAAGKGGGTGTAGTTGSAGSTAGTGGSTAGTGGSAAGTGGSAAGTGGSAAGTGGSVGGSTAGTGGSTTGGTGGSSVGGTGGLPANLPPTLTVPAGATLKLRLHATGDQVYTCTASAAGGTGGSGAGGTGGSGATTYAFVLKQPDAKLYDESNTQVGTHGVGPNWTSTVDGSVVNGARAYQENSPLSDAIPWLLLRATSNTGTGVFSDVTYVIRANTTGGKAPASGCDATTAGMDTRVGYTADYYFFNGGGPGAAWMTPPANLPAAIAVPSGATLKLHDHAIGVQVYTCTASAAGGAGGGGGAGGAGGSGATTYSWVLKQPDALLYDSSFAQVGTHGAGPNWTSTVDASVVNAARLAQAPSTVTGAIAWLLLQTSSTTGTGVFSDITYVQRLNTAGGPAPATGCDATTTATEVRIPYSADYYFFTGGTTTSDGGTNG